MSARFEMRVSDELLARLDAARGHEPRASFVRRALERALGPEAKDAPVPGVERPAAPSRAPRTEITILPSVWKAPTGPLTFTAEEEAAHVEAQRRELARQVLPDGVVYRCTKGTCKRWSGSPGQKCPDHPHLEMKP
jgi:hypothetical protein